jgi:hypothetical protein
MAKDPKSCLFIITIVFKNALSNVYLCMALEYSQVISISSHASLFIKCLFLPFNTNIYKYLRQLDIIWIKQLKKWQK